MIALESIELELDDEKRSERSKQFVFEHVALGDLFYQTGAKIHTLGFVVRVLGETESLIHVHLRQIDDDGAVSRWNIGNIDHPATLNGHRKRPGKIWGLDHSSRCRQPVTARHLGRRRTSVD